MEKCYRLKPATLLKATLLQECFSRFLNGGKLRNASYLLICTFFWCYCGEPAEKIKTIFQVKELDYVSVYLYMYFG